MSTSWYADSVSVPPAPSGSPFRRRDLNSKASCAAPSLSRTTFRRARVASSRSSTRSRSGCPLTGHGLRAKWDGDAEFDARQPFEVVRHPTSLMIPARGLLGGPSRSPGPRIRLTRSCSARPHPSASSRPCLRRKTGITRAIASPTGTRRAGPPCPSPGQLLRRMGARSTSYVPGVDFRVRLSGALSRPRSQPGCPAVTRRRRFFFHPAAGGPSAPASACGATRRSVRVPAGAAQGPGPLSGPGRRYAPGPRRGPAAGGRGPYPAALRRLARPERAVADSGGLLTGPVPFAELPAHYAAGDVFAMPCRTRRGCAASTSRASASSTWKASVDRPSPAISGDSGGAPDAILEGETGYVVPGRDAGRLAGRIVGLLGDPDGARAMGEKGRAWVEREWTWDRAADRLRALIDS